MYPPDSATTADGGHYEVVTVRKHEKLRQSKHLKLRPFPEATNGWAAERCATQRSGHQGHREGISPLNSALTTPPYGSLTEASEVFRRGVSVPCHHPVSGVVRVYGCCSWRMETTMVGWLVMVMALLEWSVEARTLPDPCLGHQWFRRDSDGRWRPAVPDPKLETMAEDSRRLVTYVPWNTVREHTANWNDTKNKHFGEGCSLPVRRCVARPDPCLHYTRPRSARISHAAVKALCVSVDRACTLLVITHDEAPHCHCDEKLGNVGGMPQVLNMTLLGECPHAPDHTESSQVNALYQKYIERFTQTPNDAEISEQTMNTTHISLTFEPTTQTPGGTSTQRSHNTIQWWGLTVDIIICALVITFIVFVVVSVMKNVNKENDLNSQQENVELASEETLLDHLEATRTLPQHHI
ncbi:uncharacterized protein [Panulirus ornatus]|uniref:uncharacterized protein n=1 Tax=Panulirus ornatus TaxID=150431 RepID=UPI003A887D4E